MRVIEKTTKKIIIEVAASELKNDGFDTIWDEIREIYPQESYEVVGIEKTNDGMLMEVTLKILSTPQSDMM